MLAPEVMTEGQSQAAGVKTDPSVKRTSGGHLRTATTSTPKNKPDYSTLDNIDLSGCSTWTGDEQRAAWRLLWEEYVDLFSMNDMDLGCTLLVKHKT